MKVLSCSGVLALGRMALMADERASFIVKAKLLDWETRDAVQALLRNVVRVALRQFGCPQAPREPVLTLVRWTDGGDIA